MLNQNQATEKMQLSKALRERMGIFLLLEILVWVLPLMLFLKILRSNRIELESRSDTLKSSLIIGLLISPSLIVFGYGYFIVPLIYLIPIVSFVFIGDWVNILANIRSWKAEEFLLFVMLPYVVVVSAIFTGLRLWPLLTRR
ncbi:MAG: hypothetical protein ACI9E9_001891 [Reinekea sp.]|jgi:hypothetical protein